MSLNEAYSLAHLAHCRLLRETSRPNRNLRLVVGHLMQYESLRLHIIATEKDMQQRRCPSPPSRSPGTTTFSLQRKPSYGQLRDRRADAGPTVCEVEVQDVEDGDEDLSDGSEDDDDDDYDADEWVEDLALARSSSPALIPPNSPPELEEDDEMEGDDDRSDEEPATPTDEAGFSPEDVKRSKSLRLDVSMDAAKLDPGWHTSVGT